MQLPVRWLASAVLSSLLFVSASAQERLPMGLCLDRQAVIAVGTIHVEPKGKIIREMPSDGARIIVEDYCCGGWKPNSAVAAGHRREWRTYWVDRVAQHQTTCSMGAMFSTSPTEPPGVNHRGKGVN